jgi:DeoR/GlpR family transcriptional regulator of sugar metabolism
VERISIDKSKLVEKFDELMQIVSNKGEISVSELSTHFRQSRSVVENWIKYIIQVQESQKLILLNGIVTSKEFNTEKNKIEKISDEDVEELFNKTKFGDK